MVRTPYYQEQVTEGLLYQKYHPGIHCLTFTDMKNETIDAAYELHIRLNKEYAKNKKHLQYLYILDDVQYTPYLLSKIKQSLTTVADTLVHSSAVVADSFFTKVLETLIVPYISKLILPGLKFFVTETEAFAWLDERRSSLGE